ncbi:hypothetical protein [Vibrio sp. 16]|uniref:hypothetical protein n=1 Tax=Vibrio sp. 16 TaxID=391586 RepID=UPI00018F3407|nr:hypothetical protein [Vibrio sp. 16]EED25191.1 hypothetical protein VPMS16_659 [Vibrio sp. 16]
MIANIFLVIFFVSAVLQIGFLAFGEVINGEWLTIASVGIGCTLAVVLRIIQKWRFNQSIDVLIEYGPRDRIPFHHKLINFPLVIMISTLFSVLLFSITNEKFASGQSYEKVFEVMQTGQRRVRYDMFEYVKLSDGNTEVYLNLDQGKANPYKRGDLVSVTLKKGFWGFYFVEKASQTKS